MASLSLYRQFETNLMLNRKVTELLLQLKSAKTCGKNYIKVRPPLAVCLFFLQFTLGLNLSCACSYNTAFEEFYKTLFGLFFIFCSLLSSFGSQDEVTDSKMN